MYELQSPVFPGVFEMLPNSTAAALGIIRPEPLTKAVVEINEQEQVLESRPHPEKPLSALRKRKRVVLWQAHFGFERVVASTSRFHARGVRY